MIFDILLGWTWWLVGVGGVAALVLWLVWALRKGEGRARRQDDSWVRDQLALVIARRTGMEPGPLCRTMQSGAEKAIPADLARAELRYERVVQPPGRVRKSLVVHFRSPAGGSQTSTVEGFTDWSALPADVRAEMIRTGRVVTRLVALPDGPGLVPGGR